MKNLLLFFSCLLCISISQSQTFNDGVLEYTVTDGTNVSVIRYNNVCPTGALIIPETIIDNSINYKITSIGTSAFNNCSALTSISIPNSVSSIGEGAFMNCIGLTSFNIPDSVTSIAYATFAGCSGLTNISIPNSVTSIGNESFVGCTSLTNVNIPDGVTSIGGSTFYECMNLTSVNIPDSVSSIGEAAFYGCLRLTSVNIPNNVISIGNFAFSYCVRLMSVTVHWDTPLLIHPTVFQGVYLKNIPLTLPSGTLSNYQNAPVWQDFGSFVLGVSDFYIATTIRLYPNPTSSFLKIDLGGFSQLKKASIYNNLGQLVSEENDTQISVSNYSKGLYFAEIETTQGKVIKKFLVD